MIRMIQAKIPAAGQAVAAVLSDAGVAQPIAGLVALRRPLVIR